MGEWECKEIHDMGIIRVHEVKPVSSNVEGVEFTRWGENGVCCNWKRNGAEE